MDWSCTYQRRCGEFEKHENAQEIDGGGSGTHVLIEFQCWYIFLHNLFGTFRALFTLLYLPINSILILDNNSVFIRNESTVQKISADSNHLNDVNVPGLCESLTTI